MVLLNHDVYCSFTESHRETLVTLRADRTKVYWSRVSVYFNPLGQPWWIKFQFLMDLWVREGHVDEIASLRGIQAVGPWPVLSFEVAP